MSELKKCPFCGAPLTVDIDDEGGVAIFHTQTDVDCVMGDLVDIEIPVGSTIDDLINKVNTRSIEDTLTTENAKLREALDELVTCTANLKFHLSKDGNYSICKSDHTDMWMGETIVIGCALEDVDKAISQAQEALKNE